VAVVSLAELSDARARIGGLEVLSGVDVRLAAGELVAVVGRNGAGKTSVLRAMLGLLPLTGGAARLAGDDLARLPERERVPRAAYLPQERRIAWNMAAVDIVALATPFLPEAEARDRAAGVLDDLEGGHLADRGVADMSGGERARVLLARALNAPGQALLLDEPVAGLDPDAQLFVLERLRREADGGRGIMLSLHDLTLAARIADRVIVMADGRVVADAPPAAALTPEILRDAFGLDGVWVQTEAGPTLAMGRRSQGA
jgi:iron complex transport system ATP-binding protein